MAMFKRLEKKVAHRNYNDGDSGYEELSSSGQINMEDIRHHRSPRDRKLADRMPLFEEINQNTKYSSSSVINEKNRKREINSGKIGIVHLLRQKYSNEFESEIPDLKPLIKFNIDTAIQQNESEVPSRKPRRKRRSKSADGRPVRQISMFNPFYTKILSSREIKERKKWADKLRMDAILDEEYYKLPYEEINKEIALGRYSRSEPRLNWKRKQKKTVSFSADIEEKDGKQCDDKISDGEYNWKEDSGFHELDIGSIKSIIKDSHPNDISFEYSNVFFNEDSMSSFSCSSESSEESDSSKLKTTEMSELQTLYHRIKEQEKQLSGGCIHDEGINSESQMNYINDLILTPKISKVITNNKDKPPITANFKSNIRSKDQSYSKNKLDSPSKEVNKKTLEEQNNVKFNMKTNQNNALAPDECTSEVSKNKKANDYKSDIMNNSSIYSTNISTQNDSNTLHNSNDKIIIQSSDKSHLGNKLSISNLSNTELLESKNSLTSHKDINSFENEKELTSNNDFGGRNIKNNNTNGKNNKVNNNKSVGKEEEARKRYIETVTQPVKTFAIVHRQTDLYDRFNQSPSIDYKNLYNTPEKVVTSIKCTNNTIQMDTNLNNTKKEIHYNMDTASDLPKFCTNNDINGKITVRPKHPKIFDITDVNVALKSTSISSNPLKNNNMDELGTSPIILKCSETIINDEVIKTSQSASKPINTLVHEMNNISEKYTGSSNLAIIKNNDNKFVKKSPDNSQKEIVKAVLIGSSNVSSNENINTSLSGNDDIHNKNHLPLSNELQESIETICDNIYKKKPVISDITKTKYEARKKFFDIVPKSNETIDAFKLDSDFNDETRLSSNCPTKISDTLICKNSVIGNDKNTSEQRSKALKPFNDSSSNDSNNISSSITKSSNIHIDRNIEYSQNLEKLNSDMTIIDKPLVKNSKPITITNLDEIVETFHCQPIAYKTINNQEVPVSSMGKNNIKIFESGDINLNDCKTKSNIIPKHHLIDLIGTENMNLLHRLKCGDQKNPPINVKVVEIVEEGPSTEDICTSNEGKAINYNGKDNQLNTGVNHSLIANDNLLKCNDEDKKMEQNIIHNKIKDFNNKLPMEEEFFCETDNSDDNMTTGTFEYTEAESEEVQSEASSESIADYNIDHEIHEVSIKDSPDQTKCSINEHHEFFKEKGKSTTAVDKENGAVKSVVRRKIEETVYDVINTTSVRTPVRRLSTTTNDKTENRSFFESENSGQIIIDTQNRIIGERKGSDSNRCVDKIIQPSQKAPPLALPRKSLINKNEHRSSDTSKIEHKSNFEYIKSQNFQETSDKYMENMIKIKKAFTKAGLNPEVFDNLDHLNKRNSVLPAEFRQNFVNMLMTKELDYTDYNIHLRTRTNSASPNFTVTRKYLPLSIINEKMTWMRNTPTEKPVYTCHIASSNENIHKAALNLSKAPSSGINSPDECYEYNDKEEFNNQTKSPTPSWTESSSSGCYSASCSPTPLPTVGKSVPIPTSL